MKKLLILCLFTPFIFTACETVIEPNLKNVEPQLVIEGEITDQAGPYLVKLSKTTNFTAASQFIGVENALVILSDNIGIIDTLSMTKSGIYQTSKITGIPLHQYSLRVVSEGKEYTAQCTMPPKVLLDTIYQQEDTIIGRTNKSIRIVFIDPVNEVNQYRFQLYKNGEPLDNISIRNDKYFNGQNNNVNLRVPDKGITGDVFMVQLLCIDKSVYTYFFSLSQTLSSQNAVPANPISNITGGCLGYFSAETIDSKQIILK